MSNEKFEKLSAFMDGEIELSQSELQRLASDDELKSCWTRYHVIRETMTQRINLAVTDDWYDKLHAQLDQEPTVLAPANVVSPPGRKVFKQVAGFAVAATVAAIAIVSLQNNQIDPVTKSPELAQVNPPAINVVPNQAIARVSATVNDKSRLSKEATSKLNGYIVNHYEYSVAGKLQGMLPYMRIVSETPAVRIPNER